MSFLQRKEKRNASLTNLIKHHFLPSVLTIETSGIPSILDDIGFNHVAALGPSVTGFADICTRIIE
jgi:hypothetical protein